MVALNKIRLENHVNFAILYRYTYNTAPLQTTADI